MVHRKSMYSASYKNIDMTVRRNIWQENIDMRVRRRSEEMSHHIIGDSDSDDTDATSSAAGSNKEQSKSNRGKDYSDVAGWCDGRKEAATSSILKDKIRHKALNRSLESFGVFKNIDREHPKSDPGSQKRVVHAPSLNASREGQDQKKVRPLSFKFDLIPARLNVAEKKNVREPAKRVPNALRSRNPRLQSDVINIFPRTKTWKTPEFKLPDSCKSSGRITLKSKSKEPRQGSNTFGDSSCPRFCLRCGEKNSLRGVNT